MGDTTDRTGPACGRGLGRCLWAQLGTKGVFREIRGTLSGSKAAPTDLLHSSEFHSSLRANGTAGAHKETPPLPSSLLFTDLIPSDQRLPLPPLAGGWGIYIIYIGNGQDSMGTSSLCLIREN